MTCCKQVALFLITLALASAAALAGAPRAVPGGVEFSYDELAFSVSWAGAYNGWSAGATPLTEGEDGVWRVVIPLGPGEYEYKLVVDGDWIADPGNPGTRGESGNSFIKVNADGSLEEGQTEGKSTSTLNSKLSIDGLYYASYQLESQEKEGDRILLEKPRHDLNLGLELRLNPSLSGRVELNIDNIAEVTEMWRTQLNFQRALMDLKRPSFELQIFDNQGLFASEDPLNLAGDVGTYGRDYGYGARGIVLSKPLPFGIDFKGLAADAGLDRPRRPVLSAASWPADSLGPSTRYLTSDDQGFRDDFAVQAKRMIYGTEVLYLARADRGLKPGYLLARIPVAADSLVNYSYRTVQNNLLHAFALRRDWTPWLKSDLELVTGSARLCAMDVQVEGAGQPVEDSRRWTLQETRGLALSAALRRGEAWELGLRHRYQKNRNRFDHLLESAAPGAGLPDLDATARSYGLTLRFARGDVAYSLDLSQEEFAFDRGLGWGDHFWFADGEVGAGNLWINGDHLPLAKYGLLGHRGASLISQRLALPIKRGGPAGKIDLVLDASVAATRLDRRPLYWDLVTDWNWELNEEWAFLFNQRFAAYDIDDLGLDDLFVDTFLELSYRAGEGALFSLGYGVDPYWLDPVSKEFLPHGRREYLAAQGANEAVLRHDYSSLGPLLRRAEKQMGGGIQRITLEARFEF